MDPSPSAKAAVRREERVSALRGRGETAPFFHQTRVHSEGLDPTGGEECCERPECLDCAGSRFCGSWTSTDATANLVGSVGPYRVVPSPDVLGRGGEPEPRRPSPQETNDTLRAAGSCVVDLNGSVLLHVLHVNTVGNRKFSAVVYSESLRRYALQQSNTTKTKLVSRLRFVSDKKKLSSRHGYKNTRIEFSSNPSRSANYTSNAKHALQPYFRGLFETVSMAQGTCVVSAKPFEVNNENLTSYMYGVANPASVVIRMKDTKKDFHTPFFFSSVNVTGEENRHQLFSSMSINSQRVKSAAEELPRALASVASLVELHGHFNRLCCELAHERGGTLTTREKVCLVYLTEMYFLRVRDRNHPTRWPGYREALRGSFAGRYGSRLTAFQDRVLSNYYQKNPEFVHLVPWLLDNPSVRHREMLLAHEAYLREEGKEAARAELIAAVVCHCENDLTRRPPEGFPDLLDVDFSRLGYSELTLRHALDRSTKASDDARPGGRAK
uniref:Uncharacterized protein n=1 Tax=Oryzias latipes TaxID=8090 RepID=A0A286P9T4_ORYLA|nr:hypothetical protein ORF34-like [Oryzias latipes]